jgi:hypothetical protein
MYGGYSSDCSSLIGTQLFTRSPVLEDILVLGLPFL